LKFEKRNCLAEIGQGTKQLDVTSSVEISGYRHSDPHAGWLLCVPNLMLGKTPTQR
jgi:hypothetical protein